MKEIENRNDVNVLVSHFYAKIQKDDLLGPIFNKHIAPDQWPAHIEKLTDFWVTNLFGIMCFKGNPNRVHKNVDQHETYTIQQSHFGHWLNIWFETIDSLFTGALADSAKNGARKMSTGLFLSMWHNRPENNKNSIDNQYFHNSSK